MTRVHHCRTRRRSLKMKLSQSPIKIEVAPMNSEWDAFCPTVRFDSIISQNILLSLKIVLDIKTIENHLQL